MFKKTAIQIKATLLFAASFIHIMLYGGSRSGKTFIIIYALIVRASKTRSRHLIVRLKFNHVKTSIWMDTLPKVLNICFPDLVVTWNKSDYVLGLTNGSEIWVAGLDDKERTEKILGKEYSTIFFNECSQIPYASIKIALTRLAEKNGLQNKCYYDENPPTKRHWSYSVFIRNKDPDDRTIQLDEEDYACLLMNPADNKENIDENYLVKILGKLPKKERDRFMKGLFTDDLEGAIYYGFTSDNIDEFTKDKFTGIWTIGQDFNVTPCSGVVCWIDSDDVIHVWDEIYENNFNTYKLSDKIIKEWGKCEIVPDSTGKARKTSSVRSDHEILRDAGHKVVITHNPAKKDRFNCVNGLLERSKIIIHPRCKHLIDQLETLTEDNIDDKDIDDHLTDGLGYLCWKYYPIRKLRGKSSTIQL